MTAGPSMAQGKRKDVERSDRVSFHGDLTAFDAHLNSPDEDEASFDLDLRPQACSAERGYHTASTALPEIDYPIDLKGHLRRELHCPGGPVSALECPVDDPRWPTTCACGRYVFEADDEFRVSIDRLWTRSDGGPMTTLEDAPVGAMYDAYWAKDRDRGWPDGISLVVRTPGGDWFLDRHEQKWQRTGKIPKVTADPSILIHRDDGTPGYHGWLRDGVLVDA